MRMLGNGFLPQIKEGFSPLSIADLQLWLDFSDMSGLFQDTSGNTPVTSFGQSIARVNDKSINGNHFTQSNSLRMPVHQSAGALFDGANSVLQGGSTGLNAVSRTALLIFTPLFSGAGTRLSIGCSDINYYIGVTNNGRSSHVSWANTSGTQKTSVGVDIFQIGVECKYSIRWSTSGSNVVVTHRTNGVNGTITNTSDGHATPSSGQYFLCSHTATPALQNNCNIRHVAIWNRALSDSELQSLETMQ